MAKVSLSHYFVIFEQSRSNSREINVLHKKQAHFCVSELYISNVSIFQGLLQSKKILCLKQFV